MTYPSVLAVTTATFPSSFLAGSVDIALSVLAAAITLREASHHNCSHTTTTGTCSRAMNSALYSKQEFGNGTLKCKYTRWFFSGRDTQVKV